MSNKELELWRLPPPSPGGCVLPGQYAIRTGLRLATLNLKMLMDGYGLGELVEIWVFNLCAFRLPGGDALCVIIEWEITSSPDDDVAVIGPAGVTTVATRG